MSNNSLTRLSDTVDTYYVDSDIDLGGVKWFAFIFELISGIVLFALMLLTCGDVIGRYLFNDSINGTTELTEFALCIIVFCQIPVVTLLGSHILVDMLDKFLPNIFMRYTELIVNVGIGIGSYFIADRVWFQASRSLRRGVMSEFLFIPVGHFVQFIAIMIYITIAILAYVTFKNLFKNNKGEV